MYRCRGTVLEVLLVHPGGPYWAKKDAGAWTIPKGEIEPLEDALAAAKREFEEETGVKPEGPFRPLPSVKLRSGKTVHAWAFEGDCDAGMVKSNSFRMEWPPRSGKEQEFPEVDRAGWFPIEEAKEKILPAQLGFLEGLERMDLNNRCEKGTTDG